MTKIEVTFTDQQALVTLDALAAHAKRKASQSRTASRMEQLAALEARQRLLAAIPVGVRQEFNLDPTLPVESKKQKGAAKSDDPLLFEDDAAEDDAEEVPMK